MFYSQLPPYNRNDQHLINTQHKSNPEICFLHGKSKIGFFFLNADFTLARPPESTVDFSVAADFVSQALRFYVLF